MARSRLPAWAVWTSAGFSASLAWRTVPTGAVSGMPATNQCRSSWPQRNLLLSSPSRTRSSRWRSAGCTSRTATSASAPGWRTISKNSPLRSACTSREMTPAVRLRRDGRSATFSRAPMRANLLSSRFVVSIAVPPGTETRAGRGGFADHWRQGPGPWGSDRYEGRPRDGSRTTSWGPGSTCPTRVARTSSSRSPGAAPRSAPPRTPCTPGAASASSPPGRPGG